MGQILLNLFGAAVFAAFFGWGWRIWAWRWRRLAAVYGAPPERLGPPLAARRMQNLILRDPRAWEAHHGITNVAIHESGLAFSMMMPFSIDRPPFFIPFADLKATVTEWYLNAESFELDTRRDPDIKLIVTDDLMHWIEGVAAHRWNAGYSLMHRVDRIHEADHARHGDRTS